MSGKRTPKQQKRVRNHSSNGESRIRASTEADWEEIRRWTEEQKDEGEVVTFHCNLNQTEAMHREGRLLVYLDEVTGKAVAYQWGALLMPGILEVRADKRGEGIGRRLVDYCLNLARKSDELVLRIQCRPASSIPFWKRMGFTVIGEDGYQVLPKKLSLPGRGQEVHVEISQYPESRTYHGGEKVSPRSVHTPRALRVRKTVYLAERVVFYNPTRDGDVVVGIRVDQKELFVDKAKRPAADALGMKYRSSAFYLERLNLP